MPAPVSLVECFADLPDPRVERTRLHNLTDLVVIAVCGVVCGAQGWDDLVEFAQAKRSWLQERLELPNGLPCADTFRRVFARLDPEAFSACFLRWVEAVGEQTRRRKDKHVAVDGKTLRHSFDTASGQAAIHMVSAWASDLRLVLGQRKVEAKSNEITAVPALLALLDLRGCIVTADAMSCQTAIAAQIVAQGGAYLLAVKDNHPHLHQDVCLCFQHARAHQPWGAPMQEVTCVDKGHGRLETRRTTLLPLAALGEAWKDVQAQWAGLASLVEIARHVESGGRGREETRYYLCSLPGNARKVGRLLRRHWEVENSLHWVLDVVFDEDACRIRKDHGPQNFAVLRHIALNLLRQESTHKRGVKARQKRAGWDEEYLTQLLTL